ncbi:MAG: hypothetical protein ABF904_11605 [Ethanoligenens sp.]
MTQEQKERVENALVKFIEKAAKNGEPVEVSALSSAVHALVKVSLVHVTR